MGAQGTATLNFGAFPGDTDTSVTVTGQVGIDATSLVEAWIRPGATADHTADEHIVDAPIVVAGNIVAGTGFTIYGVARDGIPVPDAIYRNQAPNPGSQPDTQERGRTSPMPYGTWSVAWVWN